MTTQQHNKRLALIMALARSFWRQWHMVNNPCPRAAEVALRKLTGEERRIYSIIGPDAFGIDIQR